uniref:acid phosphatase n=1 Tax=Haemonchus contortus TaxID=6289 RepID=A0A7I4XU82_HAECO
MEEPEQKQEQEKKRRKTSKERPSKERTSKSKESITSKESIQKKKKKGGTNVMLVLFVGLLLLVVLAGVGYFVLFVLIEEKAPERTTSPEPIKPEGLVSAIVLFHHGARAPLTTNESILAKFPLGAGELTEDGIEDSFKLGQFLGQRYVETGFLRSPPLPAEIYFRSRSINPSLMSAAVVGSGMWAAPKDPEFTAVPIYGQEKNDRIFTHLQHCRIEKKRLSDRCGKAPPEFESWSEYEGFVYECVGLNRQSKVVKDAKTFAKIANLIQMDRSGMETPSWFSENKEEIYKLYERTFSFIMGVNDYYDKKILQLKQGVLMKTILDLLKNRWTEWQSSHKIAKRKFIAYSVQEWLIMAFMEALGCAKEALNGSIPSNNALLMIELSDEDDEAFVQVLYIDKTMNSLKDITKAVRLCDRSPCPLAKFLQCCDDYTVEDPKIVCG